MRHDGRRADELRPVSLERGFSKYAEGSCLIKIGNTHMHVTATVDEQVPRFRKGSGEGWITAEYAMLPRSGRERNQRDNMKCNGRSLEIQRLIGRAMRSIVNLGAMGERQITLDCDAILADGGTRCAAITASYVALYDAFLWMREKKMLKTNPLKEPVAAISVGVFRNQEILDLDYLEDSNAETDMNVVMTSASQFVEIQGTAESEPFSAETLGRMLALARKGCLELIAAQKRVLDIE